MFQSVGKNESVETLSQLASTKDFFVFVPEETAGVTNKETAPSTEQTVTTKTSETEAEFSFGTTYLVNNNNKEQQSVSNITNSNTNSSKKDNIEPTLCK